MNLQAKLDQLDQYEERAAIKEYCGKMDRETAEAQARREVYGDE